MKAKELISYLKEYPEDKDVGVLVAQPEERQFFRVAGFGALVDDDMPILCIELGKPEPMDEDEVKACEEDEARMQKGIHDVN